MFKEEWACEKCGAIIGRKVNGKWDLTTLHVLIRPYFLSYKESNRDRVYTLDAEQDTTWGFCCAECAVKYVEERLNQLKGEIFAQNLEGKKSGDDSEFVRDQMRQTAKRMQVRSAPNPSQRVYKKMSSLNEPAEKENDDFPNTRIDDMMGTPTLPPDIEDINTP